MISFVSPDGPPQFPNPLFAEDSGILAVGGKLTLPWLLLAYRNGIFPWFSFRDFDQPHWYCPMERFVIFPNEIHVSHSMRTLINKHRYVVTFDEDFDEVIRQCGALREDEDGAWLGPDIIRAYTKLHELGLAHSVEVRDTADDHRIVGGLYGVIINDVFVGESMFSLTSGASKLALIALARKMEQNGGKFIDCQIRTPHLESMGGRYITYHQYMVALNGHGPGVPIVWAP